MNMAHRKTKRLREFEPILLKNGYKFTRCKGSHFIYMNRISHKVISVNKDLNKMVKERLIKENNLIIDDGFSDDTNS